MIRLIRFLRVAQNRNSPLLLVNYNKNNYNNNSHTIMSDTSQTCRTEFLRRRRSLIIYKYRPEITVSTRVSFGPSPRNFIVINHWFFAKSLFAERTIAARMFFVAVESGFSSKTRCFLMWL